jgi:hypothetical protein
MFADVIFPVFSTPYLMALFMPWLLVPALIAEIFVFKLFFFRASMADNVITVLGANAASWFVGILLLIVLPLPSGLHQTLGRPEVKLDTTLLPWAFALAFVVSIVIETAVWWAARRPLRSTRLVIANAVANAASYAVLLSGAFFIGGWHFFDK